MPAKKKTKKEVKDLSKTSLLDMGSLIQKDTKEALTRMTARKKNIHFRVEGTDSIKRQFIPLGHFGLQMFLNSKGLLSKTVYEIVGGEGIGKTTFALELMSQAILNDSPCLYINTESKWLDEHRTLRALHSDPEIAEKIWGAIQIDQDVYELRHLMATIEAWVKAIRLENENYIVPMSTPLFICVDTISKVMAPGEALGFYNYGDYLSESNMKKLKEAGESSNLEFAKLMHWWCRHLPCFQQYYNVTLLFISHQNQKVDMAAGFGAPMSADISKKYNKTKIGGNATNQNSLTQFIMRSGAMVKNQTTKQVTGREILSNIVKNTGPENIEMRHIINYIMTQDSDGFMQRALDFDHALGNLLIDRRVGDFTVESKRYSSKKLGIRGLTASELADYIHADQDLMDSIGSELEMSGYGVTRTRPATVTIPADEEAPQEPPEGVPDE